MRVFVCEFVTGGGMRKEPLPPSLAREGLMMRDALIQDLLDLGVSVLTSHDDRTRAPHGADSVSVNEREDVWGLWAELAADCDAAWAVAPETGGLLSRLTDLMRRVCPVVVGPDDEAIRICSSKTQTASRLAAFVLTPRVWRPGAAPAGVTGPFVSKPDDGAGCDDTLLLDAAPKKSQLPKGHVVQNYVAGDPASLTALRRDGRTRLLCANRQRVVVEGGRFRFRGVGVAALPDGDGRLAAVAEAVAAAIPGLDGIFGIDIVLSEDGPVVIEVNPRLTTAYAGLRDALSVNPAGLVWPFANKDLPFAPAARHVEIAL